MGVLELARVFMAVNARMVRGKDKAGLSFSRYLYIKDVANLCHKADTSRVSDRTPVDDGRIVVLLYCHMVMLLFCRIVNLLSVRHIDLSICL